ncbi:hypothetical protein SD427_13870 [Chryseobacterium sp. JJR-5R]|uniref:hypothetical protein n=1 Tax=Chryseobacterium sp. JJR-5R TaxID=3093923 RepID=UPI002A760305|nr:hypothetical protein [Chryseobacterium sp. JJR-5R]WPO81852.1 hypothetical protein SD427_13870 [Chryseobacterium sp. JJR-5R]
MMVQLLNLVNEQPVVTGYGGAIQEIVIQGNKNNQNAAKNDNSNGFSLGDAGRIAVGFIPVVGSGLDIYEGVRDGNCVQFGIGIGGLALDVVTFGTDSIIKGGVKAIGTELVKGGLELAAKDAAKELAKKIVIKEVKGTGVFVVDEVGETVSTS